MKPISLYLEKENLTEDLINSSFWEFLSERICVKLQIEESNKLLVGDMEKQSANYFINVFSHSEILVIIDNHDVITKKEIVSPFDCPVNISTKFIEFSNALLKGFITKDLEENEYINDSQFYMFPFLDKVCLSIHLKLKQEQMNLQIPYLKINYWKKNKAFAVAISHDVDHTSMRKTFLLSTAKYWLGRKVILPVSFYIKGILNFFGIRNAVNNFKRYLRIENQFNAKSTFFFLTSTANEVGEGTINELKLSNAEIGLHGDFNTCTDPNKLLKEKDELEKIFKVNIKGIRQHYLEFEPEKTWDVHQEVKLCYDSTLGFNNQGGYRTGSTFPYVVMDEFVEIPMILMDTIFSRKTGFRSVGEWKKNIFSLIDQTKDVNGLFTINWHQSNLEIPYDYIYKDILRYLDKNNCEFLKYDEIAERCLSRKQLINKITVDWENKVIYVPNLIGTLAEFSVEFDTSIFSIKYL